MSGRKFWLSLHTAEPRDGDLCELDVPGYERQEVEFGEVDESGNVYSREAVTFPEPIVPSEEIVTHFGISTGRRTLMLLASGPIRPKVMLWFDRRPTTVRMRSVSANAADLGLSPRPAGNEAAAMDLVRAWMRERRIKIPDYADDLDGLLIAISAHGADGAASMMETGER